DPRLGPLADNGGPTLTYAPLSGSPALNAGSKALAVDEENNPLLFDQRGPGFPRIYGGTVDIGAFEVQDAAPTITVPGSQIGFEDVDLSITGISVDDVDTTNLTVILTVGHGTLTFAKTAGVTMVANG